MIVHGIFQARVLEWVVIPSPVYLPNPGTELRSPALQEDFFFFLSAEPPGKPGEKKFITKEILFGKNSHQIHIYEIVYVCLRYVNYYYLSFCIIIYRLE